MSFNEVSVKESPGLCRCCLSEGCYKDLGTEYTWMNENEVYADMLLDCFDIGITQHSDGPNGAKRLICEVCITRLRDACNFKKQVLDSEKKFVDMLGRGEFAPKVVLFPHPMKAETVEEMTIEDVDSTEVEYLDDIDYVPDEEVKEEEEVPAPSSSKKRGRPKKEITDQSPKKQKVKEKTVKVNKDLKTPATVASDNKTPSVNRTKSRKKQFQILSEYTTLTPFKFRGKYLCFFCSTELEFDELKAHTDTHKPIDVKHPALKDLKRSLEIKFDASDTNCTICNQNCTDFNDLINHLNVNHKLDYDNTFSIALFNLRELKCTICDALFNKFINLTRHMNERHATDVFVCQFCDQKFAKSRDLAAHITVHHKQAYKCLKCDKSFPTHLVLMKHKLNAHQSTCNICLKTYSCLKIRLDHMKKEHDLLNAKCGFCQKIFRTKIAFLVHTEKCTEAKTDLVVVKDDRKSTLNDLRKHLIMLFHTTSVMPFKYWHSKFKCYYCAEDFDKCDDLKEHAKTNHVITEDSEIKLRAINGGRKISLDISNLHCNFCFRKFSDLASIVNHMNSEHDTRIEDCSEIVQQYSLVHDKFACPNCGQEFRYFSKLLNHISSSHSDNSYVCTYCGKTFKGNDNLRTHIHQKHNRETIKCKLCDSTFTTKSLLKTHMGSKHHRKVYKCSECADRFASRYKVLVHLKKIHNKGHKCGQCGLTFERYSRLVDHVRRLHLGEKNVQCTLCSARFFDGTRLKKHMVRHVGGKNLTCDYCGKNFLRKNSLSTHIALHMKRDRSF